MGSRNDLPLSVRIPSAAQDRTSWPWVGLIAIVGFVVGIAWPRLVGVKLGPNAPAESATVASAPVGRAAEAPAMSMAMTREAAAAGVSAAVPSASASAAPLRSGPPQIAVGRGVILSCKSESGETHKGKECGALAGVDAIVLPRIRRLASCSAADGHEGKLTVLVSFDFAANRVGADIAKSSTVQNLESIGTCLKPTFQGVSLADMPHENARYSMAYSASLTQSAPGSSAPSATAAANPSASASGAAAVELPGAQVVWEVALVRDTPKSGQIVARLQRGTKVKVGAPQEGWYRVKFGAGFATEGWVYRGAIGK